MSKTIARAMLLVGAIMTGCSTLPERSVLPRQLAAIAEIEGMPNVRGWGDEPPSLKHLQAAEIPILRARHRAIQAHGSPARSNILALSGGGENGAFGAGLLVGWGERGDRPEFDMVTGVSAGALIAPFAFLGKAYDSALAELFTRFGEGDIYQPTLVAGVLGGSALASNEPLRGLIARFVDKSMMTQLAGQRSAGRLLLIGTTNLDSERPVFWDIGRIAQKDTPEALELIRSVLLASAALPGIFPPARIRVVANGKSYEELHVDGGPTRQVFLSPSDFSFSDIDRALRRKVHRNLYIIRNGKIGPEWEQARESAIAIGQRSLYATTKYQALGDLARIHAKAVRDGIGYHLAAIPDSFDVPLVKPFDRTYMQALFKEGYRLGQSGYPWLSAPPGVGVRAAEQTASARKSE